MKMWTTEINHNRTMKCLFQVVYEPRFWLESICQKYWRMIFSNEHWIFSIECYWIFWIFSIEIVLNVTSIGIWLTILNVTICQCVPRSMTRDLFLHLLCVWGSENNQHRVVGVQNCPCGEHRQQERTRGYPTNQCMWGCLYKVYDTSFCFTRVGGGEKLNCSAAETL